jgi:hypothetical protein
MMKSVLLGLLLFATAAHGAVAASYSGTNTNVAAAATTMTLTTMTVSAGSNLCLVGVLTTSNASSSPTMNWDTAGANQAMTLALTVTNTQKLYIFVLVAPVTGNKTLSASWTSVSNASLSAVAFSGADQTTCYNAADNVSYTTNTASPSFAVTSDANGATFAAIYPASNDTNSTDTQTEAYRNNTFVRRAGSYGLGGTSNTHSWTLAGAPVLMTGGGIHILAAVSGSPGSMGLLGVGK